MLGTSKLFLIYFFLLFVFQGEVIAQEEEKELKYQVYEDTLFKARDIDDLITSLQYLDSIELLGEEYKWRATIIRVSIYRFMQDSLPIADKLIDACIEHYKIHSDDYWLFYAYEMKLFVLENRRDICASVEIVHEAVAAAVLAKDSTYIAFFEKCLGFFYLDNLLDTTNALKHFNIALDIAVKCKAWVCVTMITGELVDYYLLTKDSSKAAEYAHLGVHYGHMFEDTLDVRYYFGYIDRGKYFVVIKEYEKAIKDGLILYNKGVELKDVSVVAYGACILTEAYWASGEVDNAYRFAKIGLDLLKGEGGAYEFKKHYYWSSKIFAAKGLHKEALELFEKYYNLEKEDFEKLEVKAIARTLHQEDLKRKDLEKTKLQLALSLTKQESSFKSLVIFSILLLFLITLLYALLIYKKNKKNKELNTFLAASNEVVLQQKEVLQENIERLKDDLKITQTYDKETFYLSQSAIQIKLSDIIYLESSNNYVLIHLANRKTPVLERIKMVELLDQLPTAIFIKIHRSYCVNKNHIIARPTKYKLKLSNEVELSASRSYVENLDTVFA